jgi:hypothetical protein
MKICEVVSLGMKFRKSGAPGIYAVSLVLRVRSISTGVQINVQC